MAVTIITTAGTHTPAYNHQNLVASSNQTSQPNHRYVVTVGINDSLYDDNTTFKLKKRPDNSWLYFNPGRTAEAYIKSYFQLNTNDFFYPDISYKSEFKKVTVAVGEEYGSPVSGFPAVSANYYIWNGSYNNIEFADFVYSTSTVAKDLTLVPNLTDYIKFEQKYLFKAWHRGFSSRNLRYLNVKAYDSTGSLIQTTVIENQYFSTAVYQRNIITANLSPQALNNWYAAVIVSKSSPGDDVIPATTARYTMYFDDGAGPPNVSSNTYTVEIDSFCSKYQRYVIHFLNRYGNWDCITFNRLSRNMTDKETDMYKKIPYSLNSSNEYTYTKDTDDTVIYNTVLTNKLTLNSDWLTEDESEWLRDLFASPQIKLEIPDDPNVVGDQSSIIAVRCTVKSYETKQKVNDKLINWTIELDNSLQDVRQRC